MHTRTVALSLALALSAPAGVALAEPVALALTADAGPSVVDASAPVEASTDAGVVNDTSATASKAEDKIEDFGGAFARGLAALKGDHKWRDLAALCLILLGLLARKFEDKLPGVFQGGTGKLVLVTSLAIGGAVGHTILADQSLASAGLWRTAAAILAEAILAYEVAKRIAKKVKGDA